MPEPLIFSAANWGSVGRLGRQQNGYSKKKKKKKEEEEEEEEEEERRVSRQATHLSRVCWQLKSKESDAAVSVS